MVTFRCKRSGNTVKFSNPDDIAGMRKHEGYEEVVSGVIDPPAFLQPVVVEEPKKRGGRPKKVV